MNPRRRNRENQDRNGRKVCQSPRVDRLLLVLCLVNGVSLTVNRFRGSHRPLRGFDILLTGFSNDSVRDKVAGLGARVFNSASEVRDATEAMDTTKKVVTISGTDSMTWKGLYSLARGTIFVRELLCSRFEAIPEFQRFY